MVKVLCWLLVVASVSGLMLLARFAFPRLGAASTPSAVVLAVGPRLESTPAWLARKVLPVSSARWPVL